MEGLPVTDASDIAELAAQIQALRQQVNAGTLATRLTNSSVETPGGDTTVVIADTVDQAADAALTIPGLQEMLDSHEEAITANRIAVDAAIEAATQAGADGIAAGELASAAADNALDRAQQALDAAAGAGGDSIYTGRPPTASDPGTAGQQWFVWDSNYTVTARYVYDGDTSAWVQAELQNQVIDNLDAGVITSGYLSSARIAANTILAAQIAADTLTSREIGADAILARNIKALQITATHIAASTITGDKIAANTITAGNIAAGSITANEIAAGSITATQINLDTLNGKMVTGLTLQTATTGARATLGTVGVQLGGVASNVPSVRFYDANPDMEALDIRPAPSIPGGIVVGGRTVGLEGDSGIVVGNFFLAPLGVTIPSPAGEPTPFGNSTTFYTPTIVTRDIATYAVHDASSGRVLLDDTGWVNIPPASGYAADSTLGWRVRRTGQTVELSGQATRTASGSIAAGGALGTLPAGFRPARTRHFMVPGSTSAWARVTVDSSGSIVVGAMNGTTQYLITDEIRFFIN
jgi:hypothetical protein